jgi:aminoglycoside 6-adenylyltransferase
MRSEQEIFDLILATARADDRIRAVILNGSRANPNAPRDIFQDFDVVYFVNDVASFTADHAWIGRFGELLILQMPELMADPPGEENGRFAYLMQFSDGNRIDLTLWPIAQLRELEPDSLSLTLLDKDGLLPAFPPPDESSYLPAPPTAKAFADCCNEFWWVSLYVAKGLWREELPYARYMFDQPVREQLMKMLVWYVAVKTGFRQNPGKCGKYLRRYLEPELWDLLEKSYAAAGYASSWDALFAAADLFRLTAKEVALYFAFDYPQGDDEKVSSHLHYVRSLPRNATTF